MKKALKFMWLAALVLLIFSLMLTACDGGKDRDRDDDDDDDDEEKKEDTTESVENSDGNDCDHSFGDWIIEVGADCESVGRRYRVCSKCELTEEQETEAPGHKEEIIPAKEATTTETGLTEGKKCSVCKQILVEQEIIPMIPKPWDGTVAEGFDGGTGTEEDPYLIANGEQLAYLAEQVNSGNGERLTEDKYFKLTNNIDLGGREWDPIGCRFSSKYNQGADRCFMGLFDGNGFEVSNFKITTPQKNYYSCFGLFGYTSGDNVGIIRLGVTDFEIDLTIDSIDYLYVGGVVAIGVRRLEDCYASGSITVSSYHTSYDSENNTYAGLLAGTFSGSGKEPTIKNCYSEGTCHVSCRKNAYAGGLVGTNYAYMTENCYSTATVSAESSYYNYKAVVGGFSAASAHCTYKNCYATGNVSAISYYSACVGGFVGEEKGSDTEYTYCYATGDVYSESEEGKNYIGGFSGDCYPGYTVNITKCYATGEVKAIGDSYAGGFAGDTWATITDCYATGDVDARYAGGFIGRYTHGYEGYLANCYSTGNVTCMDGAGFIGLDNEREGLVENCFATGNVTPYYDSGDIHSLIHSTAGLMENIKNMYRYEGQNVDSTEDTYFEMSTVSKAQLNSADFYKNSLKWSDEVWDFSELDFDKGALPKLRQEK